MKSLLRKSVIEMAGYVPGEQPKTTGLVKLNTNENPYPPSDAVAEALRTLDSRDLRRYPDPLCTELRERIAEIAGVAASQVFVGNGSDEVLALCTRAYVENDGTVGYLDVSYSLYPVLAEIREARKVPVALGEDFTWPFGDNAASADAVSGCSLFFLTNPSAPTGILYPKAAVRSFCERFEGVVLIDEAYVAFASDNCLDLARAMDNVLVARTLSKSFSLAGLRVGYTVGPQPLINALFKIKDSYNVNAVSQRLALAALSDLDNMAANADRVKSTRSRLFDALRRKGHTVYPSETNFLWVKPDGIDAETLFRRLREEKVLVRHFHGARTADFLRITVGTDDEIDLLLAALERIGG